MLVIDACDVLDADHLAVKQLFVLYARLAHASPAAPDRLAIARRLCDELDAHAAIEEEVFYPALERAVPEAADVVAEGREEHAGVKALAARVRAATSADDALDATVAELARLVEHHVKEERDELFPRARSATGLDLVALAADLDAHRQAATAG